MDLFKKRKYKIIFEKSLQDLKGFTWKEVKDNSIIQALAVLQEHYNFEIINIDLKDACFKSKIVIRCNKKDKNDIVFNFCNMLSGEIEDINII